MAIDMAWLLTLKFMVADEQAAQATYGHAATQAKNPELKAIFTQLHDEEVVHQRILEGWIDRLQKAEA